MGYYSPKEVVEAIRKAAYGKDSFSLPKLIVLGIMGGAYVAFGGITAIMATGGIETIGLQKFMFGAVFPVGLILVILAGAELFTSSCAIMTIPVLNKEKGIKSLLKVWTVGYFANFVGALLVAYLFVYIAGVLKAPVFADSLESIAIGKTSNPFFKTFVKGIGANWLVCLAVWAAYAAKDVGGKILAMWFPIMAFVVIGFEHSIANQFLIPAAMIQGADISIGQFIFNNLIPATLGNIVGGSVFVGVAYWFIFMRDETKASEEEVELVKKELAS
ncbi:formate/nitrite transporter family protein [Sediminitomix flava]|uniref:Formate/nitrite transporter n=1 Tax=Sediminitomix flava TaxID=379075 RepID=A0A315ZH58_SEDFL|nr:formate/nitrite transporter family protein [Sediminitomix flava]PWJ44054.1 formate/nitrite transporter [Sediminitomix flava]